MYHILAALTHHSSSISVYRMARDLAKSLGANLHLVHVLEPSEDEETELDWIHNLASSVRMDEHRVHSNVITSSSAAAGILHEATRIHADMLVIGRDMEGSSSRVEAVVAAAHCTVLVVPADTPKSAAKPEAITMGASA